MKTVVIGQFILPDFQFQSIHEGELQMRWEPRSVAEWDYAKANGYQVEVLVGMTENELLMLKKDRVSVASETEWDQKLENTQDTLMYSFYNGAKSLIYTEDVVKDELMKVLEKEDGVPLSQTADEFRLAFLGYSISCEFEAAKMAGLAYKIKLDSEKNYQIIIKSGDFEPYYFNYSPQMKSADELPLLTGKFDDKTVHLSWDSEEYKKQYFGYFLEKSTNQKDFTPVTLLPYARFLDSLSTLKTFEVDLPLDKNYQNHWIRMKGVDYFGRKTRNYKIIEGYGFDVIPVNPKITFSDQTSDNKAHIEWDVPNQYNRLIKYFQIYRKDSLSAEFEIVRDSLPATTRMVEIPMQHNSNYFSIAMLPKDGNAIKSFPVFIMGQDTIPPITPSNFAGEIDSLGVVTLTWEKNQEPDLWGYKVFRSEFIEDEFASMHSSPISDTFFVDTINLNSLNEEIHYSVIALDKRNNRSPFSKIITIQRPDTIPPTPPLIREISFLEDSIDVIWGASSSQDVVMHQFFRKKISDEKWALIGEINTKEKINHYIDKDFLIDNTYAYTVRAIDDNNLLSELSRPLTVNTKSRKPQKGLKEIKVTVDVEEKSSVIDWKLVDFDNTLEVIVYRGKTREDISMYEILEPDYNYIEQPIKEGETWYFLFNPIFKDDTRSKMSKIIEIKYPEESKN